jgi:hypothetical protein
VNQIQETRPSAKKTKLTGKKNAILATFKFHYLGGVGYVVGSFLIELCGLLLEHGFQKKREKKRKKYEPEEKASRP